MISFFRKKIIKWEVFFREMKKGGKKRVAFKGGKFIVTRAPIEVVRLAGKILGWLKPFSKEIELAGSIRRKEDKPVDIDIVLIPKSKEKIVSFLKGKGKFLSGGDKRLAFKIEGVKVELYFTTEKSWGATFLAYSSRVGSAIGLRMVAKRKGFLLNQYGLFTRGGKYVAGKTEKDIYEALGRKYKDPWDR